MFLLFYSYIRGGLQYTIARGEKYSSKLDIFRSLIRIFVVDLHSS